MFRHARLAGLSRDARYDARRIPWPHLFRAADCFSIAAFAAFKRHDVYISDIYLLLPIDYVYYFPHALAISLSFIAAPSALSLSRRLGPWLDFSHFVYFISL